MSKIRTDRIQYFTCPSVYHQFIHGLGKPHHLAPLHFRVIPGKERIVFIISSSTSAGNDFSNSSSTYTRKHYGWAKIPQKIFITGKTIR